MSEPPRDLPASSKPSNLPKNSGPGLSGSYPNPPDPTNPDPATLREQWRFAIRQYSRWYSHAWGTAILAGLSFFALGWLIKGSNPLPSLSAPPRRPSDDHSQNDDPRPSG